MLNLNVQLDIMQKDLSQNEDWPLSTSIQNYSSGKISLHCIWKQTAFTGVPVLCCHQANTTCFNVTFILMQYIFLHLSRHYTLWFQCTGKYENQLNIMMLKICKRYLTNSHRHKELHGKENTFNLAFLYIVKHTHFFSFYINFTTVCKIVKNNNK